MSRRAARFTEADLNRAVKAADRSKEPRAVKIDANGDIWLMPAKYAPELLLPNPQPPIDDDWSLV